MNTGLLSTSMSVPTLVKLCENTEDLQYWLIFVSEVKKNGAEYPPNFLHLIVSGILQ